VTGELTFGWEDDLARSLRDLFDQHAQVIAEGADLEAFQAARADKFIFDEGRVLLRIYGRGDFDGFLGVLQSHGLEQTIAAPEAMLVEGFLPIEELKWLCEADQTLMAIWVRPWKESAPNPDHTPSPPPEEDPEPPAEENPDSRAALPIPPPSVLEFYREYQAFIDAGGEPAQFVSQYAESAYLEADKLRLHFIFQGGQSNETVDAFVADLQTIGFETYSRAGSIALTGYLPLSMVPRIDELGETYGPFDLEALPRVPSHLLEPDPDPALRWTQAVDADVRSVYDEYCRFVEGGGRAEDFVSGAADRLYLDGSRIYVGVRFLVPSDGAAAEAAFEAVEAAGLEIYRHWGSSHVEGYLPLDCVPAVGQVNDVVVRSWEKPWDLAPPPYEPPQDPAPVPPDDPTPLPPGDPPGPPLVILPISPVLPDVPVAPPVEPAPLPDAPALNIARLEDLARALTGIESGPGDSRTSHPEKRASTMHDPALMAMMLD
jgi:hypothetical protein